MRGLPPPTAVIAAALVRKGRSADAAQLLRRAGYPLPKALAIVRAASARTELQARQWATTSPYLPTAGLRADPPQPATSHTPQEIAA